MVRLLCQNFQPHCGGSSPTYTKLNEDCMEIRCLSLSKEMIDREMAVRAVQAVSPADEQLDNHGNFNFNNFNSNSSGSESSCDSDVDQGSLIIAESEDSQSGNDLDTDKDTKEQRRRDRRRQRNKVSAQAYRQRRRQQTDSQQKVLQGLEEKHKSLIEKVKRLEEEKLFVEDLLKKKVNIPWHYTTTTTTHTWPYTIIASPIIPPPTGISPPPAEMMNMTSGPMDTPTMMETEATTSAS